MLNDPRVNWALEAKASEAMYQVLRSQIATHLLAVIADHALTFQAASRHDAEGQFRASSLGPEVYAWCVTSADGLLAALRRSPAPS